MTEKSFRPAIVVAGAGIGGLAAALACQRAGADVTVLEKTAAFAPVGAGVQLGPNAVRLLDQWGLGAALRRVAASPARVQARDASTGLVLGSLPLGKSFAARYGADYLTVHRADLHRLLLDAASADGIAVQCGQAFRFDRQDWQSDATGLIACDGLWSSVRQALWPDGPPSATGHIAYRALVSPRALSSALSSDFPCDQVTVWLGAAMHAVAYPVRGGALVNLVVIVEGNGDHATSQAQSWSQTSSAQALQRHLHPAGQGPHPQPRYRAFWQAVQAVPDWTQWQLHARVPLTRPAAMAQGRVALLGDAAHPMRPYLAQGAAMALEDAAQLGQSLLAQSLDVPSAWQHYAQRRWARNARVQRQSQRNGVIFHATGPLRLARDAAMRWAGPRVMDSPWLYRG